MKQKRTKKIIKIGMLLFGVPLLFFTCIKDDTNFENTRLQQAQNADLNITISNYEHIKTSNQDISSKVEKYIKNDMYLSRTASSEYGFSIDEETVQIIEFNNFTTYTFIAEPDNPESNILENYMLKENNDGSYNQYLLKYSYTFDEDDNIVYDPNFLEIQVIQDTSLLLGRAGCVPELLDVSDQLVCYDIQCTGDGHILGEQCECGISSANCTPASFGCYIDTIFTWSDCSGGTTTSDTGGNPNSSSNGGSTNGNTNPPDDDGTTTDGTIVTVPVNNYKVSKDNCIELNKLTSPPAYPESNPYIVDGPPNNIDGLNTNIRLAIINSRQELDNDVETGFGLYNRGDFINTGPYAHHVPANGTHSVVFPQKPFQFGTIHTHPENNTHRDWIPMFSLDDIYSVLKIRNLYASNPFYDNLNTAGDALFTSILIVKQGNEVKTYAIKIHDISKFQKLQDVIDDKEDANGDGIDEYFELNKELREAYIQDANNINGSPTQYQTVLLKFLKDNDLGVSLYEMEQTNAGTPQVQENWKKLNLGDFNTVTASPCNN